MPITTSRPTSKFQVTIPAWVRKKYKIDSTTSIMWIEIKPGELTIIAKPKCDDFDDWLKNITGILKDDSWDSLEEIRKNRKNELEYEQKKFKLS